MDLIHLMNKLNRKAVIELRHEIGRIMLSRLYEHAEHAGNISVILEPTRTLIKAMNLEELIEAKCLMEMPACEIAFQEIGSAKIREYVAAAKKLEKLSSKMSDKLRHNLNREIVKQNEESINIEKATRIYNEFMNNHSF